MEGVRRFNCFQPVGGYNGHESIIPHHGSRGCWAQCIANGNSGMTDTSSGAGNKSDYTFGQIAIQENICSFEQVKECLDIQSKLRSLGIEPKKLGEILIEKGYLSPDQAVPF